MKQTIITAALIIGAVTTAPAFDFSTYTASGLATNQQLRTLVGESDPVRVRGVAADPTNPSLVVLFVERTTAPTTSWLVTVDEANGNALAIVGGNSLDALKGSATSLNQGSFAVGNGLVVYNDNPTFGTIPAMTIGTGSFNPTFVSGSPNLNFVGGLAYIGNNFWVGSDSRNDGTQRPLQLINTNTVPATITASINTHDSRAIVAIGNNEILLADRWNRRLNHISNLDTTPVLTNITPPGNWGFMAGQRNMSDLAGLSTNVYAILDDSPSGFNNELIAVYNGNATPSPVLTDLNIADIATAAGFPTAGTLNVNFHNGIFMTQPSSEIIHLYIANFNAADTTAPGVFRVVFDSSASVSDWKTQ